MRERYKHLLNFSANLITLGFEGFCFGILWYTRYSETIIFPFFRRGNWFVIGLYCLIIFFFTHNLGGYNIGYRKITDIVLSHILAILGSAVFAYLEVSMIARAYYNPWPFFIMTAAEIMFIVFWTILIRKLYARLYPPRQLLVIYGNYPPDDLIAKINTRQDKYDVCASVSYTIGFDKLYPMISSYRGIVLCDLPAEVRNILMKYCYAHSIRTYITPKITDILFRSSEDIHLFDVPLLLSRNQGLSIVDNFFKRIFDVVCSIVLLILFAPVMLIIALCIKLYDGGPVLYKQSRLTRNGEEFMIYKFRSMRADSEKNGARLAGKNDSRITPVGKIIRTIHVDELPQLINILKGEMSLVGPRPERPEIARKYEEEIPEFALRLKVKAGLTGYAQVFGKYNTTPYDKLKHDLTYIENYSFWLDIKIIMITFKVLFIKESTEGIDDGYTTASKKPGSNAK